MDTSNLIENVVKRLTTIDGIEAMVLGGSRARETHTASSNIDLGICYHPSTLNESGSANAAAIGLLRNVAADCEKWVSS